MTIKYQTADYVVQIVATEESPNRFIYALHHVADNVELARTSNLAYALLAAKEAQEQLDSIRTSLANGGGKSDAKH